MFGTDGKAAWRLLACWGFMLCAALPVRDNPLLGQVPRPPAADADTLMSLLGPAGDSAVCQQPLTSIVNTIARKVQPIAFDSTLNSRSSLIGVLFDRRGVLIHNSAVIVANDNELMLPFIPQLFPNWEAVENPPFQLFARLQGGAGARHVDVIAVFLRDPREFGIRVTVRQADQCQKAPA